MANNHGYVSTMRCTCENVDAYNRVGIYADGDLDNGVFVTLENINDDFSYTVKPATADSYGVWLVNSPEVGTTIEMQTMADPRYFYNEAGKPMSLKYLAPIVDVVEVDANCFANGTLPTAGEKFVTIGANGKLVAASQAPDAGKTYFTVARENQVAVGRSIMKTVILECADN